VKGIGKAGVEDRRRDWSTPLETRAGTDEEENENQGPCEHVASGAAGFLVGPDGNASTKFSNRCGGRATPPPM
jgi:hypothetical protein